MATTLTGPGGNDENHPKPAYYHLCDLFFFTAGLAALDYFNIYILEKKSISLSSLMILKKICSNFGGMKKIFS